MRVKENRTVFGFLLGCCLLISRMSHALVGDVWLSSNTSVTASTVALCGQFNTFSGTIAIVVPQQAVIHAVIVSTGAAGLNSLQLYDSSFTIVSATSSLTIGPINTATVVSPMVYDVIFRNGLCIVKQGTSTVQILYQCF